MSQKNHKINLLSYSQSVTEKLWNTFDKMNDIKIPCCDETFSLPIFKDTHEHGIDLTISTGHHKISDMHLDSTVYDLLNENKLELLHIDNSEHYIGHLVKPKMSPF